MSTGMLCGTSRRLLRPASAAWCSLPRMRRAASTQARAAFVYGGGADFNITKRVFVRAEYRGLVYNSPTFDLTPALGADRVTHRAEPSIGFGYRF